MYLIRNGPDYLSTVTATNSLLMMLDYHQQQENEAGFSRLIALCTLAHKHKMPVLLTSYGTNELSEALLITGKATRALQRRSLNALAEPDLHNTVERQHVSKLILASASTGAALISTALYGLRENYDVYVIWDACLQRDTFEIDVAQSRLTQAGIIPTTIAAMVSELTNALEPLVAAVA